LVSLSQEAKSNFKITPKQRNQADNMRNLINQNPNQTTIKQSSSIKTSPRRRSCHSNNRNLIVSNPILNPNSV